MDFRKHIQKAEHNKTFLTNELWGKVENYPDWVTVVTFYSALHFVEALMAALHDLHFVIHEDRNKQVRILHSQIFPEFYRLYDLGNSSRYHSIEDMPTRNEATELVEYALPKIENYVKTHIR